MNKIQKLQIELDEALKEQEQNENDARLKEASKFIGKCYSSHLFQRVPAPGKEITIRKITGVKIENSRICYEGLNATFLLYPSYNQFNVKIESYNTIDIPFPSWISSFSHEIPEALFDKTLEEIKIHADTYFDKVRSLFKQTEYISIGDANVEDSKQNWLKQIGHTFITLPAERFPNVKDILSWERHPYLFRSDQFLYTKESIEIVKLIADKMKKHAYDWGSSILERDKPRFEALYAFYNTHIKNFDK